MGSDRARVRRLRCEHMRDPVGIDEPRPLLTWAIAGDAAPDTVRVRVASAEEVLAEGGADRWHSGPLPGTTASAGYAGSALGSRDRCFWTVDLTAGDTELAEAPMGRWEMGLLDPSDWEADWIGLPWDRTGRDHRPCPHLRREFDLPDTFARARLYASALGTYRIWLNGSEVTDDRLAPGWTDYRRHVPYRTYDVTASLRAGENAIGAILGEGWYCGRVGPYGRRDHYGDRPHLRLQLEVDHVDGRRTLIVTDRDWTAAFGAERRSDLLLGEIKDMRRHLARWTQPGVTAGPWRPVQVADPTCGPMIAARGPAVRVTQEITTAAPTERRPGVLVFDLGQNIAGWIRLDVEAEPGAEVIVRHAEALEADGRLHTSNLRSADATERYVLGGGRTTLEPSFTVHGFRFAEVTIDPASTRVHGVVGRVAHTDLERVGRFACSDPLLNRIHENVVWTQRGNAVEIPTDCPQRDERLGWLGDALAFTPTGAFNYDLAAWLAAWLDEVQGAQEADGSFPDVVPVIDIPDLPIREGAPGWGDAGVVVPWVHYVWYGDERVLRRALPAASRWVDLIAAHNPDHAWTRRRGNDYGDWMAFTQTDRDLLATAYFARSAEIVARMAQVLGEGSAERRYRRLRRHIGTTFARRFVADDGRVLGGTQTAYAVALRFGLVPPEVRADAARHLAEAVHDAGSVTSGYLGVGHLLPALTEAGEVELAYQLARSEALGSWGYQVRHGATTMWERWDGWTEQRGFHAPWLNSFNHPSLGAIGEWLHATVGGVAPDPARPGFGHVVFAPRPGGGLRWASARVRTVRGEVGCHWRRDGDTIDVEVTVPATASATLDLPARLAATVDAPAPAAIRRTADAVTVGLGPGEHHVHARPAPAPS